MFGAQPKQVAMEEDAKKQPESIQDTKEERGDQNKDEWVSEMEAARRVGEFAREFARIFFREVERRAERQQHADLNQFFCTIFGVDTFQWHQDSVWHNHIRLEYTYFLYGCTVMVQLYPWLSKRMALK